ncbi:MAG: hypothetical protein RMJ53_05035 [Chitinophagales bacterium]|nr:hypothetical protein [Chitinophagales bacterium]MDW8273577.1 hypothetical protein [Chitinophagales bacterium]
MQKSRISFRLIQSAFVLLILLAFSACRKDADNWVGTYDGQAGQYIQRVLINKVDNKTLKVELQTVISSVYITYATIQAAKLVSATEASVDEEGQIAGDPAIYRFKATLKLSSKNLTISGSATDKNNPSNVKPYYFTGSK